MNFNIGYLMLKPRETQEKHVMFSNVSNSYVEFLLTLILEDISRVVNINLKWIVKNWSEQHQRQYNFITLSFIGLLPKLRMDTTYTTC